MIFFLLFNTPAHAKVVIERDTIYDITSKQSASLFPGMALYVRRGLEKKTKKTPNEQGMQKTERESPRWTT